MAETKVSDPIITFKNVSKTYTLYKDDKARFKALFFKPRNAKTNKALNNVSMVINRGESVGIVGDNGAGKSTLLKMITGVAFPDEGEITVDGKIGIGLAHDHDDVRLLSIRNQRSRLRIILGKVLFDFVFGITLRFFPEQEADMISEV